MNATTADRTDIPPDAKTHRREFVDYVISHAKTWHRGHMTRLYEAWERWNDQYFDGKLVVPYLLLTVPASPRAYGDYGRVSCFGGYGQTRIRPKLLTGEHPHLRPEPEYAEGRALFVLDVFLHESVHQWAHEVLDNDEASYKGHGPLFAGKCNAVGELLGLPPVRAAKARGPDQDLPSCAQWPHNVRPPGYYLGAFVGPAEEETARPQDPLARLLMAAVAYGGHLAKKNPEELEWLASLCRQIRGDLRTKPEQAGIYLAAMAVGLFLDAAVSVNGDTEPVSAKGYKKEPVSGNGDGKTRRGKAGRKRKAAGKAEK
jgi:hypothetical protein